MSRTIELGRAVLSSPTAKLELWLTTLITVSQPQNPSHLNQLNESELIALLSSGDVCVGRGNDMHLAFNITNQREALRSNLVQQLTDSIIAAPAWNQLELQPSLPLEQTLSPGKLCLKLDLSRQGTGHAAKRITRACASIPLKDCIPPERVPIFDLQLVECLLNITESKGRVTVPRSRRTKMTRNSRDQSPSGSASIWNEDDLESVILFDEGLNGGMTERQPGNASEILFKNDTDDKSEYTYGIGSPGNRSPLQSAATRKRPRASVNGTQVEESSLHCKKPRGPSSAIEAIVTDDTLPIPEMQRFGTMVDAAMRMSVFGNVRGSPGNVKIKASTFVENLAGIAPFLWRPGYRAAMAAASGMNPALSLSLARVSMRAKSGVLRTNIAAVTNASSVPSRLAARFWIKAQKGLLSKPVPTSVHAFYNLREQPQDESSADEILEGHLTQLGHIENGFRSSSMTRLAPNGICTRLIGHLNSDPVLNGFTAATENDADLLFDFAGATSVVR